MSEKNKAVYGTDMRRWQGLRQLEVSRKAGDKTQMAARIKANLSKPK